ncbi:MAG: hypothetical protein ACUVR2_10200 [Anaerolineae bacterium]
MADLAYREVYKLCLSARTIRHRLDCGASLSGGKGFVVRTSVRMSAEALTTLGADHSPRIGWTVVQPEQRVGWTVGQPERRERVRSAHGALKCSLPAPSLCALRGPQSAHRLDCGASLSKEDVPCDVTPSAAKSLP